MLKTQLIHPELMGLLAHCGHGDKILIADGNYPLATETGDAAKVYLGLCPGLPTVTQVLDAVMSVVRIERVESMSPCDGRTPEIFADYRERFGDMPIEELSRYDFYAAGADPKVRIAISTGEKRFYADLILTIGVTF